MSIMANGKNPVAVLRNRNDDKPWAVCCNYCKPSIFNFGSGMPASLVSMIAWAPDWLGAQQWAVVHAAEHETHRCPTCSHLPPSKVDTPVDAHKRQPAATAPEESE